VVEPSIDYSISSLISQGSPGNDYEEFITTTEYYIINQKPFA
jgi:hypothetical protein